MKNVHVPKTVDNMEHYIDLMNQLCQILIRAQVLYNRTENLFFLSFFLSFSNFILKKIENTFESSMLVVVLLLLLLSVYINKELNYYWWWWWW
jgi:hypothetical protein